MVHKKLLSSSVQLPQKDLQRSERIDRQGWSQDGGHAPSSSSSSSSKAAAIDRSSLRRLEASVDIIVIYILDLAQAHKHLSP
jgi:hypothetical protein